MLPFLVLTSVAITGAWLYKQHKKNRLPPAPTSAVKLIPSARCYECGLLLPMADAICDAHLVFCCEEHHQRHVRQIP